MSRPRALSAPKERDVAEALRQGLPVRKLAAAYGIHRMTVGLIAKRHGIHLKPGRPRAWPDCPPGVRDEFNRLCDSYGYSRAEARAILERDMRGDGGR